MEEEEVESILCACVCVCVCVCVHRHQCHHSTRGFGGETELLKWLFPRGHTSIPTDLQNHDLQSERWGGNSELWRLEGFFSHKWRFCHHLITLMLFQTCHFIFFLWSTTGDILNNVLADLFQAIAINSNWTLQDSKRRKSITKRS